MYYYKSCFLLFMAVCATSSLAAEAPSTSQKASRGLETDFTHVLSKIDKDKVPDFLEKVRNLFLEKLSTEKHIGQLYFVKVTGSGDEYKKKLSDVEEKKAKNDVAIEELEDEWKVTWEEIPFFGDYELSDIAKFPRFYTADQLGLKEDTFKDLVSSAESVYSTKNDLDIHFADIYSAKFSGKADKVFDFQEKLETDRKLFDDQVIAFKKRWGISINEIPFFGGEDGAVEY